MGGECAVILGFSPHIGMALIIHMHMQKVHINFVFYRKIIFYIALLALSEKVISPNMSKCCL